MILKVAKFHEARLSSFEIFSKNPTVQIGLSFMISSVAPTWLSTFYTYLITNIGKCNLKLVRNQKFENFDPW